MGVSYLSFQGLIGLIYVVGKFTHMYSTCVDVNFLLAMLIIILIYVAFFPFCIITLTFIITTNEVAYM